jgi:hypothetical protein
MRLLHALLLAPLLGLTFLAPAAQAKGGEHHARMSAEEHFNAANTTHDGKLTEAQAAAGYKSIARAFSEIDVNHHGYVTMDDIKTWRAAKKAARLAAKHAA